MRAVPIFYFSLSMYHHFVFSRFSLHGIYPLSLLFFPDVFSSPMWTDLIHVQDPYLRCLADKLPEVVLGARADNTTLTYLSGFKRWRSWASKFPEITVLPAAPAYVALYLLRCPSSVHFSIPGLVSLVQHPMGARCCWFTVSH